MLARIDLHQGSGFLRLTVCVIMSTSVECGNYLTSSIVVPRHGAGCVWNCSTVSRCQDPMISCWKVEMKVWWWRERSQLVGRESGL